MSGSGGGTSWSNVTNGYLWYDGALQSYIAQANGGVGGNTSWSTSLGYDGLGRLASAYIYDGKPRSVTYTNDELGQIIRRDERGVASQTGAPHSYMQRTRAYDISSLVHLAVLHALALPPPPRTALCHCHNPICRCGVIRA